MWLSVIEWAWHNIEFGGCLTFYLLHKWCLFIKWSCWLMIEKQCYVKPWFFYILNNANVTDQLRLHKNVYSCVRCNCKCRHMQHASAVGFACITVLRTNAPWPIEIHSQFDSASLYADTKKQFWGLWQWRMLPLWQLRRIFCRHILRCHKSQNCFFVCA